MNDYQKKENIEINCKKTRLVRPILPFFRGYCLYSITNKEFNYISNSLYSYAKINLTEKKKSLVISRLSKRIRALGLNGFSQYVDFLQNNDPNKQEFYNMVNALSTNYSAFFREPYHFNYLIESILPRIEEKKINIWSAGCSTGQEAFSLLITLMEYERQTGQSLKYQIFASDISDEVLCKAATGIYSTKEIEKIEKPLLNRYFLKSKDPDNSSVKIKNKLIRNVMFFKMNLSDEEFYLPKMDIVLLRNVLIYFDEKTKSELIGKMYKQMSSNGYLFLGHSESLTNASTDFSLISRTIYQRNN